MPRVKTGEFQERICCRGFTEQIRRQVLFMWKYPQVQKSNFTGGDRICEEDVMRIGIKDFFLQPIASSLPSFIRDSSHFIEISGQVELPTNFLLVTCDVESLYSNIDHKDGTEAVAYFLNKKHSTDRGHDSFLLDLLTFVLQHNFFLFDRVYYLQRSGVAMGAKCAPAYANTFLGWWEEKFVYPLTSFAAHVHAWYRFIDDIFILWKGTKEECILFFDHLNTNPHNIFLTYSISASEITFLDLRIFPHEKHLATDLFRKPTATNALLEFSSFHPWHTKVGVPTGQFLRVRRNCTLDRDFSIQARELSDRFLNRGYPKRVVSTAYQRARGQDQKALLSSRREHQDTQTRFITDFNNSWKQVSDIISKHWQILRADAQTVEVTERGNHHVRHNLSIEEKRALSALKDNKQIVIKPADKGGSIVVLDRDYYMQEIRTQLSDLDTYQPIGNNPTFEISREIKDLVAHYTTTGTIDIKLGEFLVKQHPVTPVFYTLPKIHKHPLRPPGHPIVASTESLLSPLAITLEKILSRLVPRIKSYLKDTTGFLTSLKNIGRLPINCLLVSMDMNSLYTSIRHQDAIMLEKILSRLVPRIKSYLKDTTGFLTSLKNIGRLPINCLLVSMDMNSLYTSIRHQDGIESVMSLLSSHTNFSIQQQKFCKDLLTLRKGTAMGSNMAPPYANIFMDHFELTYVYTHPSFMSYVIYWRHYIDDVFLIWTGDAETLDNFYRDLNSSLPGLTFSLSHDAVSMNFLDTKSSLMNIEKLRRISLNSLLKYDSCHPHHIKRALPKSQHVRVDRIVSNPEVSHIRHQEINEKFRTRGYPDHVLTSNRDTARSDVCPKTPRMAFISTFHPLNHLINKCILQHWDILKNAYPQVREFDSKPIICSKRCSNIKDHLVRADVGPSNRGFTQGVLTSPRNGTFPCLSCHQCSNVLKGDSFTHPRSGKRFPIRGQFTCNLSFIVYLIKCPCGLGYVGETTQPIRDRISKHKSTIRCGRTLLPIPAHFLQNNHNVAQLRFQVIDHVPVLRRGGDRIKKLKERESLWIYTLQTLSPHGLNREYERDIESLEKGFTAETLRLEGFIIMSIQSGLELGNVAKSTRAKDTAVNQQTVLEPGWLAEGTRANATTEDLLTLLEPDCAASRPWHALRDQLTAYSLKMAEGDE
ncbi:unnamed protein product [Ranitomeya imitator]|uniref:Helix-turn-helix domain-containing protein n=1 Tax=Ranitomeya imitator TaxID=111125 RepID=A0ABN9KSN4_9NEOB|nr:unnamed protein product [Ranitomeya imitator]